MVLSIRDRDKGEAVQVNSLKHKTNAKSTKQLNKPESSNPLNGQAMSGDCRLTSNALEPGVLVAPNFRSVSQETFRQLTLQGTRGLYCYFLVMLGH